MAKGKIKNFFSNIWNGITNWWNDITGQNAETHANKADELAQQAQNFNESYSQQSLAQQEAQFQQNYAQAQQNIDFQKDIAEKNLALQQDAFNAQQRENEIARQREDNAMQRQAADLKAAGLSPLMLSGGASSGSMTVGSAPQYNAQPVSTAQGSAIQLAQEYAQLRNMAQGNYLSRSQAAINERIAAQQVLSDISRERRTNFQNMALSTSNLALQYNRQKKQNELADEQITASKEQRNWMNEHGYRNQNWISVLLPIAKQIADKFGISIDSVANKIDNLTTKTYEALTNWMNKGADEYKNALPETSQELVKNIPNNILEEMMFTGFLNPKLSDEETQTIAETLCKYLAENRKMSIENMVSWIKRDGLQEVLRIAFGMKFE